MAARRLAPGERLLDILAAEHVEGYEVRSLPEGQAPARRVLSDAPPAAYVTRVEGEHGEVRVAPLVEALRQRLRRRRRDPPP